eukprot:TRINITY_DN33156_c0_g1_i1.p1 TRINITY_DN33156_c0_g1~~TRINITY_DN33156_c0_g1_i1.p1  ORF type:complete len:251 (-),score=24.63 TRINITY_DN33156_c0_g1_i1:72-824(-)
MFQFHKHLWKAPKTTTTWKWGQPAPMPFRCYIYRGDEAPTDDGRALAVDSKEHSIIAYPVNLVPGYRYKLVVRAECFPALGRDKPWRYPIPVLGLGVATPRELRENSERMKNFCGYADSVGPGTGFAMATCMGRDAFAPSADERELVTTRHGQIVQRRNIAQHIPDPGEPVTLQVDLTKAPWARRGGVLRLKLGKQVLAEVDGLRQPRKSLWLFVALHALKDNIDKATVDVQRYKRKKKCVKVKSTPGMI